MILQPLMLLVSGQPMQPMRKGEHGKIQQITLKENVGCETRGPLMLRSRSSLAWTLISV